MIQPAVTFKTDRVDCVCVRLESTWQSRWPASGNTPIPGGCCPADSDGGGS